MNPYDKFVTDSARLIKEAERFHSVAFPRAAPAARRRTRRSALFFAPHPDDETIVGALALRLLREARMKVDQRGRHPGQQAGAAGGTIGGIAERLQLSRLRPANHRARMAWNA